jgi:uncharacterized membrane protein
MSLLLLIIIHTLAGAVAILSGFFALSVNKKSNTHRNSGKVFVLAIICLGLTGVYVAYSRSIVLSLINGFFLCYFVATAWMTVSKKSGTVGKFEWFALFSALAIAGSLIKFGVDAANSPDGKISGFGPSVFYFFAFIASIAAIGDLKLLLNRGITGTHRIIRHLWRMCFPLFMSTAAFFLGQAKLIPEPIRKIELLALPVAAVLIAMVYWIIRVHFSKRYQKTLLTTNA